MTGLRRAVVSRETTVDPGRSFAYLHGGIAAMLSTPAGWAACTPTGWALILALCEQPRIRPRT